MARGLLNPSEGQRYPNLRQVLNERERALKPSQNDPSGLVAMFAIGVALLFASMEMPYLLVLALPLLFLAAMGWRTWMQNKPKAQDPLAAEKRDVTKRMLECIEHNRLEHDVSYANAELLEACAVAYLQAASALERWQPTYDPSVKARVDIGVRAAMDDAVLAHRDALPANPAPLSVGVQLGKAADTFIFGRTSNTGPIEPAFGRARAHAESLRDAAHSVEQAARELTGSAPTPNIEVGDLRGALRDLKMVQQAEEELRQDLRGGA